MFSVADAQPHARAFSSFEAIIAYTELRISLRLVPLD